ncbi:MAG: alcohol dehydrogenase catalytic domain-containing protein, partial [Dehalococcoidia bacterium]
MKAAVFCGPRDLRVEEVPVPEIGSQEILVKVEACGICGSDLHLYRTGGFEDMGLPMGSGRVMGHEFGGEVVAVGDSVVGIAPGDRVAALAMGGFAEMVRIPRAVLGRNVFQLPGEVSYEEAATLEPLAACLHAITVADPSPGDTVVVLGAGIIGLGCLQVLRASHDCRLIVADLSEKRLGLARQLGADEVI